MRAQIHLVDACIYDAPTVRINKHRPHDPFATVTIGPAEITLYASDVDAYIAAFAEAKQLLEQAAAEHAAAQEPPPPARDISGDPLAIPPNRIGEPARFEPADERGTYEAHAEDVALERERP